MPPTTIFVMNAQGMFISYRRRTGMPPAVAGLRSRYLNDFGFVNFIHAVINVLVNCPAPWWPCINVTSRVLKWFYYSHTYVLTNFEHDEEMIGTTFLTMFHDNQAINVTFRMLTRKNVDDALRTNGDPKITP
ncbi:hypothetical protein DPMN_078327 [Dreissena polymorpha]|uniref:Uncharacterized protein n=1 Tax=Dreissena polymorpha TaxID=45954 RepID=A0A9D3YQX0_DREPO|nr:hypothetical protein DPMN_078327 [Dreissena polymorpha]